MKVTQIDLETYELSFESKEVEKLEGLSKHAKKSPAEFIMFLIQLGIKLINRSTK